MYYGGYGYGYGGGFFWDNTFFLIIIGVVLCGGAALHVRSTFAKYSKMSVACGKTGADVARFILDTNGMRGVQVGKVAGNLSDNFNPTTNTVSLSGEVFSGANISAIAVAAHECGHVLQQRDGYGPYNFRRALVPVVNIGSSLSWVLIFVGVIMGGIAMADKRGEMGHLLIQIGIICFSLAIAFQLVTLPVEFNASRRAIMILKNSGDYSEEELHAARKVLTAAALTYVAGAISSILQLLRLILIFGGRRRN